MMCHHVMVRILPQDSITLHVTIFDMEAFPQKLWQEKAMAQ